MHYAPRTIALITEIFHPVIQPDPAPIQDVHNTIFKGGDPAYRPAAKISSGYRILFSSNPPYRSLR